MVKNIHPSKIEFVTISFEGPDLYSLVGGLGVRVTELSHCLAEMGYRTRLYFIGDPKAPYTEEKADGLLTYHRWCQWLSAIHNEGVYAGEDVKINDMTDSLPTHLIDYVIAPAAARGKTVVVLAEDWHTAGTIVNLNRLLFRKRLNNHCLILWNANNTFGFSAIDWEALRQSCAITTVSRYMKHLMKDRGVNPLVIPNGIPRRWLNPVDLRLQKELKQIFDGVLLGKVGRYHPDKRWLMAMEAVGEMKRLGMKPHLIVRGGSEPHRLAVIQKAWEQGLVWSEIRMDHPSASQIISELNKHKEAEIIELCFFVPEEFLRALYAAADGILANSGHEPFGLVGLEVMASAGIAITGCSGEDYAHSFVNSIVVGSDDPREITLYIKNLLEDESTAQDIRDRARLTSSLFIWELVIEELFRKIEFVAWIRGVDLR